MSQSSGLDPVPNKVNRLQIQAPVRTDQQTEITRALALARNEMAEGRKQLQLDRRRLQALRRRLKQRWHRQWSAERAAMRQQEKVLSQREEQWEEKNQRLIKDKAEWEQKCVRWHGENELARREFQVAGENLARDREELQRGLSGLQDRETALAKREEELVAAKRRGEKTLSDLTKEADGLENRIRNQRLKLVELEKIANGVAAKGNLPDESASLVLPAPNVSSPPNPDEVADLPPEEMQQRMTHFCAWEADWHQYWAVLEKSAQDLADQRLHLAEQCESLALAQARWQEEREAVARREEASESQLRGHEQELEQISAGLRQRQEKATQARFYLETWQASLSSRMLAWEKERERWTAHLQSREELLERILSIISELLSQWRERHCRELEQFQAGHAELGKIRRDLVAHRDLWLQRCEEIGSEERAMLVRFLSVDEKDSNSSKQSQHRVGLNRFTKWGRRFATVSINWERTLAQERTAIQLEATKLEEQFAELQKQKQEIAVRGADLADRELALEHSRALAEAQYARGRQEWQSLNDLKNAYERQLTGLKREVERLSGLLLEEKESVAMPIAKAA